MTEREGRIHRDEFLMEAARLNARRSSCNRLQVGAVLAKSGRILSSGYNGAPSGLPHCPPEICFPGGPACLRAVHAEANCIAFAARYGIATEQTMLYSTDSPCWECAKLIINAGIACVVYDREYRDSEPLKLLENARIYLRRYGID